MATKVLDNRVEMTYGDHSNFELNATFRCDRCGAQAYIRTTLKTPKEEGEKGELYWCVHHANKYEFALMPLLKAWHDERERLKEDRKKGSEN
jgi:transcription elongation factor Elf1